MDLCNVSDNETESQRSTTKQEEKLLLHFTIENDINQLFPPWIISDEKVE